MYHFHILRIECTQNKLYKIRDSNEMSENIQPVLPATSATIKMTAQGVFALPDEWRTTDEANPGMFTYVLKFINAQVSNGKVYPRELTEKEIREEQSKKKGGKKEGKKEENPAEAERLKELQEKEEEEERRKLEQWNKLSQEQQFYNASEDSYKSSILKLDPNNAEITLQGKQFVAFEEHVVKDGGEWVYVIKMPTANEEQMAKLKKAKPKTLANINDLNPVVMRAWVDLSSLNSDSVREATLRCNLSQVDANEDTPKPNLQKTYVKLTFEFKEPLLKKKDTYSTQSIIKDPIKPPQVPNNVKCVQQLRQQIKVALESLAMEYSKMFEKELNMMEQQKINQIFVNSRKNEPGRRKEQFLYDFNISGKYRVLKERLKKVIVSLCEHKFTAQMNGAKSFTGVTCSMRDQFYSQIYDFLVTEYSGTMSELIEEKRQILNEVYVLGKEYQQKGSQELLQSFIQESKEERLQRIISEHLQVGNAAYGAELYQKQIKKNPQDISLKYEYSLYCLRNGLKNARNVIAEGYIEKYMEAHKSDPAARITYVLLMIGSEVPANLNKAWVVLREAIEEEQNNIELLLLGAVLFQILKNEENSKILFSRASREHLRRSDKLKSQGKHREDPQPSQIPSLANLATYSQELSNEEKDGLWGVIIAKFSELGLLNVVEILKNKLTDQEGLAIKKQNLKLQLFSQKYESCQQKAIQIFKQTSDMEVFTILVASLTKLNKHQQIEKYLKFGLKVAPEEEKMNILLKLGYFYLKIKKYGNAKACLVKYLEKVSPSGGLSWQILGTAELKMGNQNEAIKCFRFSNLSDPYNPDIWISLANAYAGVGNLVMVNQCLNSYEGDKDKISQVQENIQKIKPLSFYEASMKAKLSLKFEGQ